MKTEEQIRKRLKRCLKRPVNWFCDIDAIESNYATIRVLKWVLKMASKPGERKATGGWLIK